MTQKKRSSGFLKRAFAGISLITATGCGGAAASLSPNTPAKTTTICPENTLPLTFEAEEKKIPVNNDLREKFNVDKTISAHGVFNDDSNKVSSEWFALMGRQEMLLKIPGNAVTFNTWLSQFDSVKDGTIEEKDKAVTSAINRDFIYVQDKQTYGQRDYWASPIEMLAKRQGDCEDFATLKYAALRYLDVPAEKLHILIVDSSDAKPGTHAVLLVNGYISESYNFSAKNMATRGDDTATADDDDETAQPARTAYAIYYAVNETGTWSIAANSVPQWGTPRAEPAVCVPIPEGAKRPTPPGPK